MNYAIGKFMRVRTPSGKDTGRVKLTIGIADPSSDRQDRPRILQRLAQEELRNGASITRMVEQVRLKYKLDVVLITNDVYEQFLMNSEVR